MHCIIQGVKIIDPTSPYHLSVKSIRIHNGVIAEIADVINNSDAQVYDYTGNSVSPGWMDMMAAFGDPGHEYKETITTGVAAAAAGGFTAVGLMPNTEPALHSKSEIAYIVNKSKSSIVAIHPYGAITHNREGKELTEIYDMHHAGAVAFTDADVAIRDAGIMLRSLQYVKPFKGVIINIPNDHKIVGNANVNEGVMSVQLGMYGIPDVLEELMVIRDIKLAEYADSHVHFGVISSAKSLPHIREAKKRGIKVTAGVAAYQLFFDESMLFDYDTRLKVNPPLRSKDDVAALIEGLADGTIDVICSYHLPHENDAKDVEFEYAAFGMESLEASFAAACKAIDGKLTITEMVEKMAINPRNILQLPIPSIKENNKAEFTIFNENTAWDFNESDIRSRSHNTAFIGKSLKGKPLAIVNNNQLKQL
ncbi:MAG TPA: dihydroorotase [Chitinophagales bacterium]|nr:dihydroorotase [Chitinophagales bacterium]